MNESFVAHDEFLEAVSDIDLLLDLAKTQDIEKNRIILYRSGLLLLTAKFEAFLETIVEEFLAKVLTFPGVLTVPIKMTVVEHFIGSDSFLSSLKGRNSAASEALDKVTEIWKTGVLDVSLEAFNVKFSYGKHGSSEIDKLFRKIGIEGVFDLCVVEERIEALSSIDPVSQRIDIMHEIDGMIAMRNNILHEGAEPNLTVARMEQFKNRVLLFAGKLQDVLLGQISFIIKASLKE